MIKQRQFKHLLLMLIAILAISLICIAGCAQQKPFIPEYMAPIDGYYTEITFMQMDEAMLSGYVDPEAVIKQWQGKSFVIKNIKVDELALSTLREGHVYFNNIKCIPQRPADLLALENGDVIDLTGVFADIPLIAGDNIGVIVLANCQFLPAGLYPLPLPGSGGLPLVAIRLTDSPYCYGIYI